MLAPLEIGKLKGVPRLRAWLIALSAGPLIALSQPPVNIPFLALVALAPLFLALPRLSPGGSWLAGFGVGLCYFGGDMWWLGQMVTDPGNEWVIFGMFVFVVLVMSTYWGVAAMVTRWLLTRKARWMMALVPLAWLGIEFMHEFNTPVPYPWLPLGAAITEFTLLVQTADIWGQYGLTATVVLVNLAIARSFELAGERAQPALHRRGAGRVAVPVAAAVVVLVGGVYGFIRIRQVDAAETEGPMLAVVQGNLAQEVKVRGEGAQHRIRDSYLQHVLLSAKAAGEAELICWAETMLFGGATREGLNRDSPALSAAFFADGVPSRQLLQGSAYRPDGRRHRPAYIENLRARIAHEIRKPMLIGAITDIPEAERDVPWKQDSYDFRYYNTALLFDEKGRVVDSYDKRYLVPGGEHIPHEDVGWIRALIEYYAQGLQGYTSRVEPGQRLTVFELASEGREQPWRFTSTICYEYAWPGCYRELHGQGGPYPDFHVNISNEGWFKESAELDQAVDFCRLRCIESRKPMIRATNTGISCHIDAAGRVREVLTVDGKDREVQGVLLARPAVLRDPASTLFVSVIGRGLGHVALWVTVAIMALMAAGRVQQRRARKAARREQAVQA